MKDLTKKNFKKLTKDELKTVLGGHRCKGRPLLDLGVLGIKLNIGGDCYHHHHEH